MHPSADEFVKAQRRLARRDPVLRRLIQAVGPCTLRPNPDGFAGATRFVTPEQVAEGIACGPDVEEHVNAIRPFVDAGFTEVALVQIGAEHQQSFFEWAERELLPALRAL